MKPPLLSSPLRNAGVALLLAALESITLLSVRADGETPSDAPRLAISQPSIDGHVRVGGTGGAWGAARVIEASSDLVHWTPILTNLFHPTVGPDCLAFETEDCESSALVQRFY